MIGDDQLVDSNTVHLFEFDGSPLETLDPVKKWAEMKVQKRTYQYNKAYPWRDHEDKHKLPKLLGHRLLSPQIVWLLTLTHGSIKIIDEYFKPRDTFF
jgi:hypothetical protein